LANMVEGGRSPLIARDALTAMGFNFIIYPVAAMAASAAALQAAYQHLLTGDPRGERVSFAELSRLVGFDK